MHSKNNKSATLACDDCDADESTTNQDSVGSCLEELMLSDGSHLGSESAGSIDPDSIGDPLADGLLDQEILGPEFGSEDPIVNLDAIGEEGRLALSLKADPCQ